jgi:hypothetical protein
MSSVVANRVRVHCNACSGTGQRKLTPVELETLICIGRSWTPTSDITSMLGGRVMRTALSMRLANLADYGLIQSRRVGHATEWRRV